MAGHRAVAGSSPPFSSAPNAGSGMEALFSYAGATFCPIAHKKAAISRAIAAATTGGFLPAA